MTIGNTITYYRKKLGITQEALAQKLMVTNQAVSKWELDQSCPDVLLLPVLADIFGITIDALFDRHPASASGDLPWEDDKTLRVVVYQGHALLADYKPSENSNMMFRLAGDTQNVQCALSLTVEGNVYGSASAGGSLNCEDVMCDVHAGGSVNCDSVKGNVQASGSVNCDKVEGYVEAGGSVSCDDIGGNVQAGGTVTCDHIGGSCTTAH